MGVVSLDVYDEFKMFTLTFFFESVGKRIFGGERTPKQLFMVMGLLHHPLATSMICPWMQYPDFASIHMIAASMSFAAGIRYSAGSYKFTLDITKVFDWYQFKAIVVLQTVTILYTRGYIWFLHLYIMLSTFWADGNGKFFYGGCVVGTLVSLFNMIMIADAVRAAFKWLPRGMLKEGSLKHDDLHEVGMNIVLENKASAIMTCETQH